MLKLANGRVRRLNILITKNRKSQKFMLIAHNYYFFIKKRGGGYFVKSPFNSVTFFFMN